MIKLVIIVLMISGRLDGGVSATTHELSFKTLASCLAAAAKLENIQGNVVSAEGYAGGKYNVGTYKVVTQCVDTNN